jgi:hypothetical protein
MRRYVNSNTVPIIALWIVCGLFWIGFWYLVASFLYWIFFVLR